MMPTPPTPAYQPVSKLLASGDTTLESFMGCVNSVPFEPKYLLDLGLFTYQSEMASTVLAEYWDEEINLIQSSAPGAPGVAVDQGTRTTQPFLAPRLSATVTVLAEEVAMVRQLSGVEMDTVETAADRKVKRAVRNIRSTMEWHRLKAAQGRLLDANGAVLIDFYQVFGIDEPTGPDMAFGTTSTDYIALAQQIKNQVEDALGGLDDNITPIVLCGRTFFERFSTHPNVTTAYQYFQSQQGINPLRDDIRYMDFEHGGVIWRQYRGSSLATGRYLADAEARVVVPGVPGTYTGAFCPPRDIKSYVNRPGLPLYMTSKVLDHDAGWELKIQSNPVHILNRPKVAIKLTSGN